ncbi:MAG: hypothetical protein Q9M92_08215 [Enterobacterales bacterium]|nr:hypothetical protein [Enterobacterales bacterium]
MRLQAKQKTRSIIKAVVVMLTAVMLNLSLFSTSALAKNVSVDLKVSGCSVTVATAGGDNCDKNQCNGAADCVCMAAGDDVSWLLKNADGTRMNDRDNFKIIFGEKSPLTRNCGDTFSRSSHQCGLNRNIAVGQSYDYQIYLKRCRQGTDPRIIIK